MDREALLAREEETWKELAHALVSVPDDGRNRDGVVPGWSAHDLAWHCAHWADWAADAMDRIRRGESEREEPEDDDAWTAEILAEGRTMSWEQVIEKLNEHRGRAREALEAFEGDIPQGAVDWFEDDAIDHYGEHAAQIRAFNQA